MINNFLTSGHNFTFEQANNKFQFLVLNISLLVAFILSIALGLNNDEHVDYLFSSILPLLFIALRYKKEYYKPVFIFFLTAMFSLIEYGMWFTPMNSKFIWLVIPIAISFHLGTKAIGYITTLLTIFSLLLYALFGPMHADYGIKSITETILALSSLGLVIYLFEYNHIRNIKILHNLNTNLEEKVCIEIEKNRQKDTLLLQQAQYKQSAEMLNMLAHQWRQPLSSISVLASRHILDIQLDSLDTKELASGLQSIINQTNILSSTINSFSDSFAKNSIKSKVEITTLLKEFQTIVQDKLEFHDVALTVENDTTLSTMLYKNELLQALLNILENSFEAFTLKGIEPKIIKLIVTHTEKEIILTIIDNAGGIDNDQLHDSLKPYFSTKEERNNVGLGLFVTKQIITKMHHGTIDLHNANQGLEVTITLPIINQ